ncbi:MAG: DUF4129 domain-containing protein [Humibacillus sp.]|nr:DUF4129 domain-containing protein [Humibacillus sp.]MDN5778952.1 DUF4129 domain-containing protein [Humibacillus sp.]
MSRRGVIATAVAGVFVAAALLVASLAAPLVIVSRPVDTDAATRAPAPVLPTLPSTTTTTPTSTGPPVGTSGLSAVFGVLLAALGVAVAVLIISLIVAAIRSAFRRPSLTRHAEATFAAPPVPDDLLSGSRKRLELLEAGEPRNAIVAAWLDLEQAAGETGLPRRPAETSTEYTARVIGTWEVDQSRLGDLGGLYREARFSVHPLDEGHRRRAIDDLSVLQADLERVARTQQEAALQGGSAGEPP